DVLPMLAPSVEEGCEAVLASGRPLSDVELDAGRRRWRASFYPVQREPDAPGVGLVVADVTAQTRTRERLATQSAVSGVLAESSTVGEAAPRVIELFCRSFGWAHGQLWRLDPSGTLLRCEEAWADDSVARTAFVEASRGLPAGRGVGL